MPKLQEIKTTKNSTNYKRFFLSFPNYLVNLKNLKKGDEIKFIEENGRIYLDFGNK